ncbi:unnamed protein product [Protopolystoma xenopodis]|uniref:Fanconi anaemia group A protein N-terminal domain-containing protein n=1 Tax=Protopolystoma xenopodis TaxID=117903 RepID=A0A448WF56_9PLAT|nr:unnamed protein product [Protopolystoma xenopodis]
MDIVLFKKFVFISFSVLLRQLLTSIFSPSPCLTWQPLRFFENEDESCLNLVGTTSASLEDFVEEVDFSRLVCNPSGRLISPDLRLAVALLLARQLAQEDPRLTGFTYSAWWQDTFSPAGVLVRPRNIVFLAKQMTLLLPWETRPTLLSAQVSEPPYLVSVH